MTAAQPATTATTTAPAMNRIQRRVFDELLAIGGGRPRMPADLVERLETRLRNGLGAASSNWSGSRIYVSKSAIVKARQCEGLIVADQGPAGMVSATAVGIVAHRAVQIAYTHPQLTISDCVAAAADASMTDTAFAAFWEQTTVGQQSDLLVQITAKVVDFCDSFPPLSASWVPRFEASFQSGFGAVILGTRIDLVLGRPRTNDTQTMFLADLKTGALRDEHADEAMFYALVSTLHHGVAPFRSTVYSLVSHEWTDPDVNADRLFDAADACVDAVERIVEAKSGRRELELTPGRWCTWCPSAATCEVADPTAENATPVTLSAPNRSVTANEDRGGELVGVGAAHGSSIFDID